MGEEGIKDGSEVVEAVGGGEVADHPLICGVVVAVGVDSSGPVEDGEVEVGEGGVVVELVL